MSIEGFKKVLTETQRANWRRLLNYMRNASTLYNHRSFNPVNPNEACILSYAIAAGMIGCDDVCRAITKESRFIHFRETADMMFGKGAFEELFKVNDTMAEWFSGHGFDVEQPMGADDATRLFSRMLEIDPDNIKHAYILWKNNTRDYFLGVEAIGEFLKMNPHRVASVKKIKKVLLVERIVHDEVEENIILPGLFD